MNTASRREGAAALLRELQTLRADVVREGDARFERWRTHIQRREFCASALNLAQYLALRSRDVRMLQQALTPWGLSSRCGYCNVGGAGGRNDRSRTSADAPLPAG
jgi:hypothetical protein